MIATELLAGLEVFASLSEGELDRVAALMTEVSFEQGDWIFREGERGDTLFVVVTGSVDIVQAVSDKVERVLVTVEPGAVFGEMVLVDAGVRSASARCQVAGKMLCLVRRDFLELAAEDSDLGIKVFLNLAILLTERLREGNVRSRSALRAQFSAEDASALTLARLIEEQTEVEVELVSGSKLRGAILGLDQGPAGAALTLASADGSLHLVACHALAAVHTFVAPHGD